MEQSTSPQETSIADLFVPEAPAAQPQETPPVEQVQPPAPVAQPQPEPKPPTVPLAELLEQRHSRQLAEQEARHLRQQLEQFQRSTVAQQPPPPPIDPVADPEGAYRALAHEVQAQALTSRANTSEMLARRQYGDEKVDLAVQAAVKTGFNRNFITQADPYKALMDWHTAQAVAQQVGSDPAAYRERIRQEVIAELKAGRPAAVPQNIPPSLSTATNALNSAPVVKDDTDFFRDMFAKPKPRT